MFLSTTATVFVIIIVLEVTIIVTGNVFTIFVFWTQRLHWKRTYLLLINLAVADLFVGLGEALVLAINTIPNGGNEAEKKKKVLCGHSKYLVAVPQCFFSFKFHLNGFTPCCGHFVIV